MIKKKIKKKAVNIFLSGLLFCTFWLIKMVCYFLFVVFSVQFISQLWSGNIEIQPVMLFLAILSLLMFAQLFRTLSIAVDNLQKREYIYGVFTCVVSLVALIIAIISLFKS